VKSDANMTPCEARVCQRSGLPRAGIWLFAFACFWLACSRLAVADDNPGGVAEYQVKAVYLYKFTEFTDWPAGSFTSADAPLVIGIVGENPFGSILDDLTKGEVVRGHPLVVKRLQPGDDLRNCQVLFISHYDKEAMPTLFQKLKDSPVLTVGDATGFADQGGMINFVIDEEKVKLEINQSAAEEAGLQISAKLLKLAHIVKSN
jgi:hypothetical protein